MNTMTTYWPSPAKLNLFLYITGRNSNDYHELQTLFHFLDISDELTITANSSGKITLTPNIPNVPLIDNLIWKAATALQQRTQCTYGADIQLKKILPIGGGIGGGSSNAATTLIALNYLWGTALSDHELAKLGLELGADVPVFIHGFSAFAEGVGEKLTRINLDEKFYLVIKPDISISTKDIFVHPELKRNTPKRELATLLELPYENDCEKVVRMQHPEVDKQLSWLLQYAPSRLTGTGSCLFAEFSERIEAESVLAKLPDDVSAFIARGCNTSPLKETLAEYQSAQYQ